MFDEGAGSTARVNEEMNRTAEASGRSVQGIGRLNSTLASMARQAAGVHPIVGQLANTISTFALGTVTTTGVLAGIAAVGYAIRKWTEDARTAREEMERLAKVLLEKETLTAAELPGPTPLAAE